nr:unnamed protein product [Callosobruchus analis]
MGQQFFYKHIFGLFLSKLLGLIALLSLPLTLKILILTNMSSTPMTAYRRYMATIFHMCIWYDEDFTSERSLRLWASINKVRNMHNAASNKANVHYKYRINQMDMALTQFGFMGISLIRSEMVGVHNVSEVEWKGFIHLWRVVGHVLGIDDRFNICQDSVIHTKKICELLIQRVFLPHMRNTSPEFHTMSKALLNGLWVINPMLQHDVFILYLHLVLENSKDFKKSRPNVRPLGRLSEIKLKIIMFVVWALQLSLVRIWYKYLQIIGLWMMRNLPFLAYYKYGRCVAHVSVD